MSTSYTTLADKTDASVDALMDAASRETGLSCWNDEWFRKPLQILLEGLTGEALLTDRGLSAVLLSIVRRLGRRLQIQDYFDHHPEIAQVSVPQPTIITGFARTGTTFLQGLLANDPAFRVFQRWELFNPVPPPDRETYETDPRRKELAAYRNAALSSAQKAAIESMHEASADAYEECYIIFEHSFTSRSFPLHMHLPSYERWLVAEDMTRAYGEHFQWLQLLLSKFGCERLLLKAPQHLANLDVIFGMYPKAKIIWTHRTLFSVVPSVSSLISTIREIRSEHVDRGDIGEQCLRNMAWDAECAMSARDRVGADSFCDVAFAQLRDDPMAVVRQIYQRFNYELGDEAVARMHEWLRKMRERERVPHRYELGQFGLHPEAIKKRLHPYQERFAEYLAN